MPGIDDDLEDVELFHDFMRMLAPPPRIAAQRTAAPRRAGFSAPAGSAAGRRGSTSGGADPREQARAARVFARMGCAACHVRSLTSGESPVAALRLRAFQPYSDFLLHDMGSLGDGIEQGQASGREMRTAPLWGLRLVTTFLHDGSAHTIADAILAHDGQGRAARDRFAAASPEEQAMLIAFLRTL